MLPTASPGGRPWVAATLGVLSALASPVAALFSALGGGAHAIDAYLTHRRLRSAIPGIGATVASLAPVGALAVAFPEGGSEPFTVATLWPIMTKEWPPYDEYQQKTDRDIPLVVLEPLV